MQVKFKKLEAWATDEGFTLELLRGMGYDEITGELARHLGLASPDLLRLTQQNGFSQQPMRAPLRHRSHSDLARLLSHSNHPTDTLYYEVLDLPLPQLEQLKTLKARARGRGRCQSLLCRGSGPIWPECTAGVLTKPWTGSWNWGPSLLTWLPPRSPSFPRLDPCKLGGTTCF